jgi:aminoglycoside phosphotransferase family enzyme/predicted kinase
MNAPGDHQRLQRTAEFRFYEELNDFLPPERRKIAFEYRFHGTPSVRDCVQAIGVPHTAVDLILVNGTSVGFGHRLEGGERVAVYPEFERLDIAPVTHLRPEPLRRTRFILDVHLGKLARDLRMLGFDAAWRRDWDDETIIDKALDEHRIILTRDRGILKQARVTHGYWLRHHQPGDQLIEVIRSLDLLSQVNPFSRCMECNGDIDRVGKAGIRSEVSAGVFSDFDAFWRCRSCGKIYWQGSHYREMLRRIMKLSGDVLERMLRDPSAYPHEVTGIQVVETHISRVFLTGEFAYKVKKPVSLGFLDFSTLDSRKFYCEEELRINRRTAPDLYLEVVPIGVGRSGLRIGAEPALEWAVRMRQFPHEARLDRRLRAGELDSHGIRRLAREIATFHSHLPPGADIDPDTEFERVTKPTRNNFTHLDPGAFSDESQQQLAVIEAWTSQQASLLRETIEKRTRDGFVRECHGDLHLENLLLHDDRFVLFDAIEFSENLRWIDPVNDIAFLAMDLLARGRDDLAFILLNAWLEETGDYPGLAVMRFYLVYRAMVRAVVTAIRQRQAGAAQEGSYRPEAAEYIELAAGLVDTPPPCLYLMHGFSGSGKTWVSSRLVGELAALRVRSDVERKRLPVSIDGEPDSDGIEAGLYRPDVTERTYEKLAEHCATGLRAGFSMIADATFLDRGHRQRFFEVAGETGARLKILDCRAPVEVLRSRLERRAAAGQDASDADLAVLEHQLAHHDELDDRELAFTEPIDCSG